MLTRSHPSTVHLGSFALLSHCQGGTLLFQYTFSCHHHSLTCPLKYSKFSLNNSVSRMVSYCLYYKELHSRMCSPPKMCVCPPVSAFTVKTKADVLAHFRWLYARQSMKAFPCWNGHSPSILIAALALGTLMLLCQLCPGLLLVISDTCVTLLLPHRRSAARMGFVFPVSGPQGHLPVHLMLSRITASSNPSHLIISAANVPPFFDISLSLQCG